jgi:ADP-heptose:LPS heptosyltransferase
MRRRLSKLTELRHQLAGVRRLLVVDLGFLGDTIHTLPALWELKQALPETEIHVLSTPVGCEVLQLASSVDQAVAFPLQAPSPPWWKHTDILRSLRRKRFDCALSFTGSDRNVFITAASGAGMKVIHDDGRPHVWRTWLVRNWVPRRSRLLPVLEQRRQVLACLGFELHATTFDLRVDAGERRWAAAAVPANALHFSINASSHIKEWPLNHWVALARQVLHDMSAHSLVATGSGSVRERDRLAQFAAALDPAERDRLILFGDPLPIPRLAAVLERCQLHVGADSGVLHLAMALGVPTVSIFRDYEGLREWRPEGPQHRTVTHPCDCEQKKRWGHECDTVAQCLREVPATDVALLVQDLVSSSCQTNRNRPPRVVGK